jgi:hypothetical protein
MDQLQVEIARRVLPQLPADIAGWSMSGGSLTIAVESVSEAGLLTARMSSFDVHDGMRLVIPINNESGGGYDIVCELAQRFYRTGIDVTVELAVIRVERRKPYRSEPRAALNALCLIRLLSRRAGVIDFEGKLVDVSAGGIGITTDRPLDPGDRLEIASQVGSETLRCTLIAMYTDGAAFGRFRTGCRIESSNAAAARVIAAFVEAHGTLAGAPSQRRRQTGRAA